MPRPVLITALPRSGKSWLAVLLSTSRSTAALGREPMNPKAGQYALSGSLRGRGWMRLEAPTPWQMRKLRSAYSGHNPLLFGRAGHRQWRAVLPGAQVVLTDPFAMLSLSTVRRVTDARVVLLYRHPGAILAAYRERGWTADLHDLRLLGFDIPDEAPTDVEGVAALWSSLYAAALEDADADTLVVSHAELARSLPAVRSLIARLELRPGRDLTARFARSTTENPDAWRTQVAPAETELITRLTAGVFHRLEAARTPLPGPRGGAEAAEPPGSVVAPQVRQSPS